MAEIGLFPLELVLLPTERVPLHVFEDRYRELIGECLEQESDFGLVLEDADGLRGVGTHTGIVEVMHRFEDGRMNVLAEGGVRFRVVELTEGRSFPTAEVEPFDDEPDPPPPEEVERALAVFRRLVSVAEAGAVEEPAPDSPALSFELAAKVDLGNAVKQELLELRSERGRLVRLSELFERGAVSLAREREVRERASGNGRVSPSGRGRSSG